MPALLDHKKLCKEMSEQALTQETLAERAGISDRHLRNLRSRDTNVSMSLLYSISAALRVPMDELVVLQEDRE